ncbi:TolC family protein [candidate division WOR-3 bacterium]|nr:TolC family protein [candidate division WOR-3 bacterium]
MKRLLYLKCFLIFIVPFLGNADNAAVLDLSALIEEAKANNPGLQALKADYEAAGAKIPWARYLADPIIAAEFSENMRMYSVTLPVPFPTKITSRSDFARTETDYYYNLYQSKIQQVTRDVKKTYAGLFLLYRNIATAEKSIAFLKQIHSITAHKYSINEVSQAEVLRAQVELARSENQLVVLRDDVEIAEARMNALLNRDLDTVVGEPGALETTGDTLELSTLYTLAEENQPLLKAYELQRREAEVMLSMARQTYLPDFALRYTLEHIDNDVYNNKYMVGVTIPIWFWGKQRGYVKEAEARLYKASAHYQTMENSVLLAVKEAKTRVGKFQHVVDFYKNSILPQAEAGLKSALAAYEVNTIEFQSLLESEKLLVQIEFEYEQARVDLFMAVADLEEAVGLAD